MRWQWLARAALPALTLLLSACGFHLQGGRELPEPLQKVFIETVQPFSVADPVVETALRSRLRRRGADVSSSARGARSVLRLEQVDETTRVLSVGADGRSIEVEISVEARFSFQRDGKVLIPAQTVTARRPLSFPSEEILPKEAEEARLKAFLQEELAELILLQLEIRLRQPR